MNDAFFFGYGSLVNRKTHGFDDAHRAHVTGWRRAWRRTPLRSVAFLTALPDPDSAIDGLIAAVPGDNWADLDAREHAYDRVGVSAAVIHPLPHRPQIAIYAIPEGAHDTPSDAHPILLSYVDVVLQGYLHEFGAEGVTRFVTSTDGWNAPVMEDRSAPVYPRHQTLSAPERRLVDAALERAGARRIPFNPALLEGLHA